jgi:hypothetical protein
MILVRDALTKVSWIGDPALSEPINTRTRNNQFIWLIRAALAVADTVILAGILVFESFCTKETAALIRLIQLNKLLLLKQQKILLQCVSWSLNIVVCIGIDQIMTKAARPTKSERYAAIKAGRALRKPKYTKPKSGWKFFKDVAKVCVAAKLEVHVDAKNHWNSQTTKPSQRKIRMADEKYVCFSHILNGTTSGIKRTAAQKTSHTSIDISYKDGKKI